MGKVTGVVRPGDVRSLISYLRTVLSSRRPDSQVKLTSYRSYITTIYRTDSEDSYSGKGRVVHY